MNAQRAALIPVGWLGSRPRDPGAIAPGPHQTGVSKARPQPPGVRSQTTSRAVVLVLLALAGCGRESPATLAYRAQADFASGRYAEAEASLTRLAQLRRLSVSERLLLSQAAGENGHVDQALAALDGPGLPRKGPDAALVAARRGELELQRHRLRAAESELKRALDLSPGFVDARRRLLWLYVQQGRAADISAQARLLSQVSRLDFLDMLVWTLARHEPLDLADLADVLQKAIQADPDDRISRLALAEYHRQLGQLDEADKPLETLPATDPEARLARARIALDRGDSAAAESLLGAEPRDGEPEPAAVAELRGRLALGRSDAAAAVRHYRAALQATPDARDAQFGLGLALRLASLPEAARAPAEAARAQDRLEWLVRTARPPNRRNDPAAIRPIAETCLALGRRDEARGWYRLALSLAPDDATLLQALSQLDASASPHQ